jgi:3-hydroxymyristoyl/3-hydroxydecanoyl-(acyl carrier protein) dehydratase
LHLTATLGSHFGAFSFVDRITELAAGKHAKGQFRIPPDIERFAPAFTIEAAGQLAAWVAMSQLDFRLRPVAGIAGGIRFGPPIGPGQMLDLAVDIEDCDEESVKYTACAHVGGVEVVRIGHSLGPMLPMQDFDDPQAVSSRFKQLCGAGAGGERYRGVLPHDIEIIELVPGQSIRAALRVPARSTPFFRDHFPRKPVFPGTMLLDAQIEVSLRAAAAASHWAPGADIAVVGVPETKIRSFISPGDLIELHARFSSADSDGTIHAKTSSRLNGRQIALGALEIVDRNRR